MPEKNLLISARKSIVLQEENDEVHQVIVDGMPYNFPDPSPDSNGKRALGIKLMREYYAEVLKSHFENLIILTGAGSSVGFGGPLMRDLWQSVENHFNADRLRVFCEKVGFDFNKRDLEGFLSRASVAKDFITLDNGENLAEVISQCESIIYSMCKFSLPEERLPHVQFMNKVTNRKLKDPRVKVFTLNYDTLFEQASTKGNFTVIDGFSFTSPRTMSGRNFDYDIVYREKSRIKEEESFVPKVFHLYKPHGSVNWKMEEGGNVIIDDNPNRPLLIYPKDSKYENSYEQPFFEMMSRFQQNLRNDNVMLICIGFSFWDKHIVTAIKEAVEQNPSFRLLIVNPGVSPPMEHFIQLAKKQFNITYISETFKDFADYYPYSPIYSPGDHNNQSQNDEPLAI